MLEEQPELKLDKRRVLHSLALLPVSGCLETDSGGSENTTDGDEGSVVGGSDDDEDGMLEIDLHRVEDEPETGSCLSPDEDPLRDTTLLELIREKIKETPPPEWPSSLNTLGTWSLDSNLSDSIQTTFESLPKTYDGVPRRPTAPCIAFEEYTIAITSSVSYNE